MKEIKEVFPELGKEIVNKKDGSHYTLGAIIVETSLVDPDKINIFYRIENRGEFIEYKMKETFLDKYNFM